MLWSQSDSMGKLTECAEGLAVAMLNKMDNYAVVQLSAKKWWVLWVKQEELIVCNEDDNFHEDNLFSRKCCHPICKRVREVKLLDAFCAFTFLPYFGLTF